MNEYTVQNKELYYRLIAFWVICEAFAGGIMHAVNIPFTGMIVSALAVTSVILIAYYIPGKTAIIRATLIVAVFKLMLSPQSPPPAYIAVFFQGLLGQLLFSGRRHFRLSAIILAVLSLVESAVQKILVALIIYGDHFWKAVDQFVKKLVGGKDRHYSMLIAEGYILIHALVGILVGILAVRLVKKAKLWSIDHPELLIDMNNIPADDAAAKPKKRRLKPLLIIIWLLLIALFMQAWLYPKQAVLPVNDVLRILLRAILILLSWYLILMPVIMRFMKKQLASYQKSNRLPIQEIMLLLPDTKYIFKQSWTLSTSKKGFSRFKLFCKILFANIL